MTGRCPSFDSFGALLVAFAMTLGVACDDAKKGAERRAAELVGDIAADRMAELVGGETEVNAADMINIPIEVRKLADNIYQARGVGNTQLIATSAGNVVFDTGLAIQAAKQRRLLEEAAPGPTTHVIMSHSHADHFGGNTFWLEDGTELIAHAEFTEEQRYLKELEPFQFRRNRMLFPFMPEEPPDIGFMQYGGAEPTITVDDGDVYSFEQGGVRFEVLPTPGAEGADNVCLWLPDQKILFSGDFFGPLFPQFPNIFTMRGEKVRKPIEYIRSLDRLIELEPVMIIPTHNDPVEGREGIKAALIKMRDAVQYVHDGVIAGMNAGKTLEELMVEVKLPPELELSQVHGLVSWGVKSIWEYYMTWFHFDTTTELYAVPAKSVYDDIVEMAGKDAVVARAQDYVDAGSPLEALHLVRLVLDSGDNDRGALETRRAALEILLDEARSTFKNSYQIDWLKYRIRDTDSRLVEASGT